VEAAAHESERIEEKKKEIKLAQLKFAGLQSKKK
jgi:hypothetical protein